MNVVIRKAGIEDLDVLVEMQEILFNALNEMNPNNIVVISGDAGPFLRQRFENRLMNDNELILIAEVGGEVAGMAAGIINFVPELQPSSSGYIRDVWVYPKYRRMKIATGMHDKLIEYFRINRVKRFSLSYLTHNKEGANLWESLGYKPFLYTAEKLDDGK